MSWKCADFFRGKHFLGGCILFLEGGEKYFVILEYVDKYVYN